MEAGLDKGQRRTGKRGREPEACSRVTVGWEGGRWQAGTGEEADLNEGQRLAGKWMAMTRVRDRY